MDSLTALFLPHASKRVADAKANNQDFVHYTSADSALKIICSEEIWLRNASCMNDYSEILHGIDCLASSWRADVGTLFKEHIDSVFPGMSSELADKFDSHGNDIRLCTYLSCVSEHSKHENLLGRLSMWRAYGGNSGVALVFSGIPFLREEENPTNVYSSPVAYMMGSDFNGEFQEIVNNISYSKDLLRNSGKDAVFWSAFTAFVFAAIGTKHPGFSEEREWRVLSLPTMWDSDFTEKSIVTINGEPQIVYKFSIKNRLDLGVNWLDIRCLLKRVIIGPGVNPYSVRDAFIHLMQEMNFDNPEEKVVVSDIPLR